MKKRIQVIAAALVFLFIVSAAQVHAEEIKVRLSVPTVF